MTSSYPIPVNIFISEMENVALEEKSKLTFGGESLLMDSLKIPSGMGDLLGGDPIPKDVQYEVFIEEVEAMAPSYTHHVSDLIEAVDITQNQDNDSIPTSEVIETEKVIETKVVIENEEVIETEEVIEIDVVNTTVVIDGGNNVTIFEEEVSVETNKKPFTCEKCQKMFSSLKCYGNHIENCVKGFSCILCMKTFKSKKILQQHMK